MKDHKKTYGGEKQDATERTLRRRGYRTNNNELINCKCGGIVRNQIW